MLGDGFAIKPNDTQIYAPVAGTISTLFPTKHAIGIKTDEGLEILIHLGLDTVELKGAPFTVDVKQGDKVEQGQPLATMDFKQITDKAMMIAVSLFTPTWIWLNQLLLLKRVQLNIPKKYKLLNLISCFPPLLYRTFYSAN